MKKYTDNNPMSDTETSEDNLAVDGLLREFFRYQPGTDENYIRQIMNAIEKLDQDDNNDNNKKEPQKAKGILKQILKKFRF